MKNLISIIFVLSNLTLVKSQMNDSIFALPLMTSHEEYRSYLFTFSHLLYLTQFTKMYLDDDKQTETFYKINKSKEVFLYKQILDFDLVEPDFEVVSFDNIKKYYLECKESLLCKSQLALPESYDYRSTLKQQKFRNYYCIDDSPYTFKVTNDIKQADFIIGMKTYNFSKPESVFLMIRNSEKSYRKYILEVVNYINTPCKGVIVKKHAELMF